MREIHPLQDSWSFFTDEYFQNMLKVIDFKTVEGFWRLFNNIPSPSILPHRRNYRMFKNSIQPFAEDPENICGGQWILSVAENADLDKAYLEIVLAVIGNTISTEGDVNGVVLNARFSCSRISVWVNHGGLGDRQRTIGRKLRELVPNCQGDIVFKLHQETSDKNNSAFLARVLLKA